MAREALPLWSGSGLVEPGPPTSFAAALSRISSQWLTPDLLSSPSGGKGAEQARDDREPMPGRISCGTQTLPDLAPVVWDTAHGPQRDGGQPSGAQDSPSSRPRWSPVTEERLRDILGGGDEGGGLRGASKEGSRRVSTGEEGREAHREWYQRMLLAIKLKQAKRVEDMEARFEDELRRRTEMHEAALHQMAAQATVASSHAQACAVAQAAAQALEEKLAAANGVIAQLQGRLQQQEADLELKREYDLYKMRSSQDKERAELTEKHRAQLDRLQAELRQAAAVQEEEREAREALKLQHEAEIRHLKTEHAAQFAGAHAQVVAAQQAVAAREEVEAAHSQLAVAEVRREHEVKLAAAMRAMQDSHAERCSLLEQEWQQALQHQSREYELVINELRSLLASQEPHAEPVPGLWASPAGERPDGAGTGATLSSRSHSRTGQRPPAGPSARDNGAPAAQLHSRPLSSAPPARASPSEHAPKTASESNSQSKRGSPVPARRVRPVTPPRREPLEPHRKVEAAPLHRGAVSVPRAEAPVPYQTLISSLQALDRRKSRSPSHQEGHGAEGSPPGRGAGGGLGLGAAESAPRPRPPMGSPGAKRAPGGDYLDRLLRQLREEKQRQGNRDEELLSTGARSLPDRPWTGSRGNDLGREATEMVTSVHLATRAWEREG